MKYVHGADKIIKRLDGISNMRGLIKGITEACKLVEAAAVDNCPVDTSELQGSIHIIEPKPIREPAGIVGTNKEYAPYVEMGSGLFAVNGDGRQDVPWRYQDAEGNWHTTSGQKPQPFLGPALRDNADEVKKLIAAGIRGEL